MIAVQSKLPIIEYLKFAGAHGGRRCCAYLLSLNVASCFILFTNDPSRYLRIELVLLSSSLRTFIVTIVLKSSYLRTAY